MGIMLISLSLSFSLSLSLPPLSSSLSLSSLGNCLNNYKPNKISKPQFLPTAVFSHTEDYGKLIMLVYMMWLYCIV